jgi:hypothetical protein
MKSNVFLIVMLSDIMLSVTFLVERLIVEFVLLS